MWRAAQGASDSTRHQAQAVVEETTHERSRAFGWCKGGRAFEQQSGDMTARHRWWLNGGHRGGRHEGAVTVTTRRRKRAYRWWQAAADTAGGCMKGQERGTPCTDDGTYLMPIPRIELLKNGYCVVVKMPNP